MNEGDTKYDNDDLDDEGIAVEVVGLTSEENENDSRNLINHHGHNNNNNNNHNHNNHGLGHNHKHGHNGYDNISSPNPNNNDPPDDSTIRKDEDMSTILHPDYQLTQSEGPLFKWEPSKIPEKLLWIFYIRTWIWDYNKNWLKSDIRAGLTVAGMAIPQAIAYTGVIGVSPSLGLYTACIGLCLYPLLGTARHLTIGCSSLTTILTAAILIDLIPTNNPNNTLEEYTTQVKTLALMAGVFYTALAMFGLGFLASFLAYPVLLGFTAGAALQIASSQIRYCFAISGHGTDLISNVKLLKYLDIANWKAFACCITTLAVLLTCKIIPKKFPNWKYASAMKTTPMTLVLIILFTIINYGGRFLTHTKAVGPHKAAEIVGKVDLSFPTSIDIDTSLISKYPDVFLLEAVSMCVVEFTAFYSVAGSYAVKYEYDLIPTRELYAHGFVNLIGSLFGVYPAGGVIVHAPLAEQAGARTLVFNWFSAVLVIFAMILISNIPLLLYWLPRSVLAGIVWNACIGMFPYEKMMELSKIDTKDSYIVIVTLLCTALWGVFEGIEVGFALSILLLLQRSSKPYCSVLGRIPNSSIYGGITTWPDAITTNGIIIFRVDGAVYFGNTGYLKRAVQVLVERNRRAGKQLYFFILNCQGMNDLDSSGVLALDTIAKYLQINHIILLLTDVRYPVMKLIRRSHLLHLIGERRFFHSVFQAHMNVYGRILLSKRLQLTDVPFDYIDNKGVNLINFSSLTESELDKVLSDKNETELEEWGASHAHARLNPLAVKKEFELIPSLARISLAEKAPALPLHNNNKPTNGKVTLPNVPEEGLRVA